MTNNLRHPTTCFLQCDGLGCEHVNTSFPKLLSGGDLVLKRETNIYTDHSLGLEDWLVLSLWILCVDSKGF